MIRALLIVTAFAALAACASSGGGAAWYESGDATYDDLKRATEACKANGGELHLREGGDPQHLGDYACLKDKGR
jgi:hypothetical protein